MGEFVRILLMVLYVYMHRCKPNLYNDALEIFEVPTLILEIFGRFVLFDL